MASVVQLDKAGAGGIEQRNAKPPATISPEIRSWIDNVIVPGLVEEFLSAYTSRKTVAEKSQPVVTLRAEAEGNR
jgi:hypothetical protein